MPLPSAAKALIVLFASASMALSHEFWISPEQYQIAPGGQVVADLRVGQDFDGPAYAYMPANFARFEAGPPGALRPVDGRMGDRPALSMAADGPGLLLIVHETTDSRLIYRDWTKFTGFVQRHDLGDAIAEHAARGLPETGFRESYRRFAKSLVAVGGGAGADVRVGLDVEIVAESNPYTLPAGAPVIVRLYENGAPRGNAQLEVFARLGSELTYTELRSDAEGRVAVPLIGGSEALLNFVVLYAVEGGSEDDPVWRSHWASLTFAVPE